VNPLLARFHLEDVRVLSRHENRLVIRGNEPGDGRPVIFKCLAVPHSEAQRRAFQSEFLLLDGVAHPYWAQPRGFGSLPDGSLFFKLKPAPGDPLSSRRPPAGWNARNLEIVRRILSGLDALHRLGFAHLDLKPEQVIVAWDRGASWAGGAPASGPVAAKGASEAAGQGTVEERGESAAVEAPGENATEQAGGDALERAGEAAVEQTGEDAVEQAGERATTKAVREAGAHCRLTVTLVDLGLAAPFATSIRPRGTAGFMAPEILTGEGSWDRRADLYAFGALLHWLVADRPVFSGTSASQVLAAQLDGFSGPRSPGEFPARLGSLLEDLLAVDPRARPADCSEVWSRLRDIEPQGPSTTPDPRLTASPFFTFQGRQKEVDRFTGWIGELVSAPEATDAVCRIAGEPGIGKRRLAARLASVAQILGWTPAEEGAPARRAPGGPEPDRGRDGQRLHRVVPDPGGIPSEEPGKGRRSRAGGAEDRDPGRGREIRLRIQTVPHPAGEASTDPAGNPNRVHGPRGDPNATAGGREELLLELAPLPTSCTIEMVRGGWIETEALAERVARLSLGNPHLLHSLVRRVPHVLDLGSRHVRPDAFDRSLAPSPEWVEWIRVQLAALNEEGRDAAMFLALTGNLPPAPETVRSLRGQQRPRFRLLLGPLQDRGILVAPEGRLTFASRLWSEAVVAADPDRASRIGRRIMDGAPATGSGDPGRMAQLALRLGDAERLAGLLEPGMAALHARFRFEEEIRLFGDAARLLGDAADPLVNGGPSVSAATLSRLVEAVLSLGHAGKWLPDRWKDGDRGETPAELDRVLRGWRLLADNDVDGALEALGTQLAPVEDPVGFARICLRSRALSRKGDLGRALEELRELRGTDRSPDRRWEPMLRLLEFNTLYNNRQYLEAQEQIERIAPTLARLSPPDQALFLFNRARIDFQLDRSPRADEDVESSRRIWRRLGFSQNHLTCVGYSAALAFEENDLARAQQLTRQLLHEWLSRGDWENCADQLNNLALVGLNRGQLGISLQAARDARHFALRARSVLHEREAREMEARILVRMGQHARAEELIHRQLEGEEEAPAASLHDLLGESLLARGCAERGRAALVRAKQGYLEDGAIDEVSELLVTWMQLESDLGEEPRALDLYREMAQYEKQASPLARSKLLLTQAEMAAEGYLDLRGVPGGAESLLRDAARDLREHDLGYYSWRAHWRLGQLGGRGGRREEAEEEYRIAGALMMNLTRSLGREDWIETFLELPAPSRLIEELPLD
jgi:serine/threonine protein kinase